MPDNTTRDTDQARLFRLTQAATVIRFVERYGITVDDIDKPRWASRFAAECLDADGRLRP